MPGPFPFTAEQYAAILRIRHKHYANGNMQAVIEIDIVLAGAFSLSGFLVLEIISKAGILLCERSEVNLSDCDEVMGISGFIGESEFGDHVERMRISLSF